MAEEEQQEKSVDEVYLDSVAERKAKLQERSAFLEKRFTRAPDAKSGVDHMKEAALLGLPTDSVFKLASRFMTKPTPQALQEQAKAIADTAIDFISFTDSSQFSKPEDDLRQGEPGLQSALGPLEGLASPIAKTLGIVVNRVAQDGVKRVGVNATKLVNKELNKFEDKVVNYMDHTTWGLNKNEAVRRALVDTGMGNKELRTLYNMSRRTLNNDLKLMKGERKTLEGKIRKYVGKIHLPKLMNDFIQPASSALRDMSPRLLHKSRQAFMRMHERESQMLNASEKFLGRGKLGKHEEAFTIATMKGDRKAIEDIVNKTGRADVMQSYEAVRRMLNQTVLEYRKAGIKVKTIENFFPRAVKDVDGLIAHLSKSGNRRVLSNIDRAVKAATVLKAKRGLGKKLSKDEYATIVNEEIRNSRYTKSSGPAHLKERTNNVINKDTLKYYYTLNEGLVKYVDDAAKEIEKARFFGKSNMSLNDRNKLDVPDSLGNLLAEERLLKNLTAKEHNKVQSLLMDAFYHGDIAPHKFVQNTKNLLYLETLGQFKNAATQGGDIGLAAWNNSVESTLRGMFSTKWSRELPRAETFNLTREMNAEFGNLAGTAKWLDTVLRVEGFKMIDKVGKTANIRASIIKGMDDVVNNPEAMRKTWEPIYGKEEYANLVKELKALKDGTGKVTENVKLLSFHKLSDIQPISHLEFPPKYLQVPNGRLFYMLQSFTIKQMDNVRTRIVREAIHGDPVKAAKEFGRYALLFGGSNMSIDMVKDWLDGKPVKPEPTFINAMWKNFNLGSHTMTEIDRGNFPKMVEKVLTLSPPTHQVTKALEIALDDMMSWSEKLAAGTQFVPVVGSPIYMHFGGGIEDWYIKEQRRIKEKQRLEEEKTPRGKRKKEREQGTESGRAREKDREYKKAKRFVDKN